MKKICIILICILINISSLGYASNFNMTYVYGGTTQSNITNMKNTNGVIDEVSPSYFDINSDGTLKISEYLDTTYINEMHNMGVKVVPFLSNHWDRNIGRAGLNNYINLSNQIVEAIYKYNLDGVNVDIENVTEVDNDNYTNLVKTLREKLPAEKTVSVAVAANPNGWTTGWHGSYDYKELGKYADYIMVMAYDEHYEGGTPGPVASYDFIKNSIEYTLKYVPKEKVVIGLAFFGRYWNENGVGGRGASDRLINQILQDYNSTGIYDVNTKSMKATIYVTDKQAQKDKYIFSAGTYTFWYENAYTLNQKIELIDSYGLKGTGSWALGQEMTDIWDLDVWKQDSNNSSEYIDVTNDMWSKEAIYFVKNIGLMKGKENNIFSPKENITRAEVATIITRLISEKNITLAEKHDINFIDIQNSWAYNNILKCSKLGIINGYEDSTFKPDNEISRQEFVTMLNRLNLNLNSISKNATFKDVSKEMYSYTGIINMTNAGIINGYEDNTFRPNKSITREEVANILYNICK